ncbi:MAG: GNAT family N-acetyltransferase [Candidatus Saliniplasma sp.]
MKVSEVGLESSKTLYTIWKRTEGKYSPMMSKGKFIPYYFEDPRDISRPFLIEQGEEKLGAVMLSSYEDFCLLHDWVEDREPEVFEKVVNALQSSRKIKGLISLFPYFGREDYFEDWEREGFSADERALYHILMRKEILDENEIEKRRIEIEKLSTPENDKIENLADIIAEISPRFSKAEMIKGLKWELEGDMSYYLALKDGKIVGYSGIELRELSTDKTMYWIKELGVHPDERRKGIATELLKNTIYIVKEKGAKEVYIDTHSENPAKKLYEKLGFQGIEKLPNLKYEM